MYLIGQGRQSLKYLKYHISMYLSFHVTLKVRMIENLIKYV